MQPDFDDKKFTNKIRKQIVGTTLVAKIIWLLFKCAASLNSGIIFCFATRNLFTIFVRFGMSSYYPSSTVRHFHNLPHLTTSLELSSNEFYITQASPWNDYTQSLFTLPIIIGCIGWIAIIGLALSFFFRCCCNRCCQLGPKQINFANTNVKNAVLWAANVSQERSILSNKFFYFCLMILLADQIIIVGNLYLSRGLRKGDRALGYLTDVSNVFSTAAYNLENSGATFQTNLQYAEATCNNLKNYDDTFEQYMSYIGTYADIVEPVPEKLSTFKDTFDKYGHTKKNETLWILYFLMIVIVVTYAVGIGTQRKKLLEIAILSSIAMLLAYTTICCIEMGLLVGLADFCMDPTAHAIQALSNQNTQNVASYYSTCEGTDPLATYLNSAYDAFAKINISLPDIAENCQNNVYIGNMMIHSHIMVNAIGSMKTVSECPMIQAHWQNVFNYGVCNDMFTGLLIICLLYQYFGVMWTVDKDEIIMGDLEENDPFRPSSQHGSTATATATNPLLSHSGMISLREPVLEHHTGSIVMTKVHTTGKGSGNSTRKIRSGSGRVPGADDAYNPMKKTVDLSSI
eukprot:gene6332-12810_t